MSLLEFDSYHPVVEILVRQFDVEPESLENLHEQLIALRTEPRKLKDSLIKYKATTETVFQKALAS